MDGNVLNGKLVNTKLVSGNYCASIDRELGLLYWGNYGEIEKFGI